MTIESLITDYWGDLWNFYWDLLPSLAKKVRAASTDQEAEQAIRDYIDARPWTLSLEVPIANQVMGLEKIRQKLAQLQLGDPPKSSLGTLQLISSKSTPG